MLHEGLSPHTTGHADVPDNIKHVFNFTDVQFRRELKESRDGYISRAKRYLVNVAGNNVRYQRVLGAINELGESERDIMLVRASDSQTPLDEIAADLEVPIVQAEVDYMLGRKILSSNEHVAEDIGKPIYTGIEDELSQLLRRHDPFILLETLIQKGELGKEEVSKLLEVGSQDIIDILDLSVPSYKHFLEEALTYYCFDSRSMRKTALDSYKGYLLTRAVYHRQKTQAAQGALEKYFPNVQAHVENWVYGREIGVPELVMNVEGYKRRYPDGFNTENAEKFLNSDVGDLLASCLLFPGLGAAAGNGFAGKRVNERYVVSGEAVKHLSANVLEEMIEKGIGKYVQGRDRDSLIITSIPISRFMASLSTSESIQWALNHLPTSGQQQFLIRFLEKSLSKPGRYVEKSRNVKRSHFHLRLKAGSSGREAAFTWVGTKLNNVLRESEDKAPFRVSLVRWKDGTKNLTIDIYDLNEATELIKGIQVPLIKTTVARRIWRIAGISDEEVEEYFS